MPHCDPDILALRALGEPAPAQDEAHLASCPACQSSLDQLRAVVTTARAATAEGEIVAPPAHVWTGIAAELGLTPTLVRDVASTRSGPTTESAEPARRWGTRRRVALLAAAAAVVGLLVGVVTTSTINRSGRGEVLAQTALEPVDAGDAHGLAVMRKTSHGRVLRVDLLDLPTATNAYYEVWLMNADTGGAVSLGSLDPSQPTTFDVPAGLRLGDFPYVDISLEPLDGVATHSSDSVARGRIGA